MTIISLARPEEHEKGYSLEIKYKVLETGEVHTFQYGPFKSEESLSIAIIAHECTLDHRFTSNGWERLTHQDLQTGR